MTRGIALWLVWGSLAWSQTIAMQKNFLNEVGSLPSRTREGLLIDPVARIGEELGFSAASAEAVLATARAYESEADLVDAQLRKAILTRRLQIAGEFVVTYSAELDMVNWATLDLNLSLLEQMDELGSRLGEEDYLKLMRFLEVRAKDFFYFPLRDGEEGPTGRRAATAAWTHSPLSFWRDVIKVPLSGPDAESLFVQNYKDAAVPPEDAVPYLEGKVVSVTQGDSGARKVLLAMQDEDVSAEVALLIDGEKWKLRSEPAKGTTVLFRGAPSEFTREPFLIQFAPERITGLAVITDEPNLPFTVPGLVR